MGNRVLLIIDVQAGFINDWTGRIPETVEKLQHRFERVFASRFENPEGSPFRKLKGLARFVPGMPETALAFSPRRDARIFVKTGYSAAVPEVLAAGRDADIHLCGIATDNCVLATAIDLFESGIRPVILADACASHGGPPYHDAGILLLKRIVGEAQVTSVADVLGADS
jgi:nicotinamidase-related amidase